MKFKIYYASGIAGDRTDEDEPQETEDFKNRDAAIGYAYDRACEEFDSYAGMHGIPEEDEEGYEDERENSIEYDAIAVADDNTKKLKKDLTKK